MKAGSIPTSRVSQVISDLVTDRWPHGGGVEVLAEKVGCDWSAIDNIIKQEYEGVSFDLVDKILCGLGRVDLWQGELVDVYSSVWFVETCGLHSCGKTFPESLRSGKRKRFCSDLCRSLHHHTAAGKATGHRHVQRGRCFKGHKMTLENSIINVQPDGAVKRQCRTCRKASLNAYKRNRRQGDPAWRERENARQRDRRARLRLEMSSVVA